MAKVYLVDILCICVHRVIILNRGSMFAFQWREFFPPLSSAHRLLQCYHSQWEIGDAAIPGEIPLSPSPLGSLTNERAVSSDVTLWRCTFWSGKFASVSPYSIVEACSLSLVVLWLCVCVTFKSHCVDSMKKNYFQSSFKLCEKIRYYVYIYIYIYIYISFTYI